MITSSFSTTSIRGWTSRSCSLKVRVVDVRTPILVGFAAIAIGVGSLAIWSCTTSIASATVVPGVVVVDSGRKYIEHLLGGTVKAVMVKEDQEVKAGQTLVEMDSTTYNDAIDSLQAMLAFNIAQQARLECELSGCLTPSFPNHVELVDDVHLEQAKMKQARVFVAQKVLLANRIEAAQADKQKSEAVLRTVETEIHAEETKSSLTRSEFRIVTTLAREGNGTRQRVIEVARAIAEIEGELSSLQAQRISLQHDVKHEQLEVIQAINAFHESAAIDLQQADREHEELVSKLRIEIQGRNSCMVTAPVAGRIVNLTIHTIGGVVAPGTPLLEIVPSEDELVLDAKISSSDIENIVPGLVADVKLPGIVGQKMPRLTGHVIYVSADRIEDTQNGAGFFRVRVEVSPADRLKMGSYKLRAGADVTLMIKKGEQPPLDYLLSPLASFFGRSWS